MVGQFSLTSHLANSYANFTGTKESFYWNTYTAAVLAHQFAQEEIIELICFKAYLRIHKRSI